jgi:superfamily I DNA and/or RNA helicase
MNETILTLSRAIKEKKWLQVTYRNQQQDVTKYWIGIKDILENKRLLVDSVKYGQIEQEVKELTILVESILEANLIDSTYYPNSTKLIEKIENNHLQYSWLSYFDTDHEVLEYYKLCAMEDTDLEERNYTLLTGFDQFQLINNAYKLQTEDQIATIYKILSKQNFNASEERPLFSRLSMNVLAIRTNRSIRPVFYRDVRLNLNDKSLYVGNTLRINTSFKTEHAQFHIKHYVGMETKAFLELYQTNPKAALTLIEENLHDFERLDTSPYLAVFQKSSTIYYEKEYQQIASNFYKNELSKPLFAFFGKLGKINRRVKRDYPVFLTTNQINFDQLRGVFNAINQDITYIQGPPGTGKTHMIKEVAISSLFNDRTMLIVSNNNEAIEQVDQRLNALKHSNKAIPFISLRLGNYDKTQEALEKIKRELIKLQNNKDKPDEKKLQETKAKITSSLTNTNNFMEAFERRGYLGQRLEDLETILKLSNEKLLPVDIKEEIKLIKAELKELPNVTEEQLINGIKLDERLLAQYLYFSSIKRLAMLNRDSYVDLKTIILSEDPELKVEQFNDFIANNDNLNRLLKVFPIIVTTNMSAARLGDASVHFDLMIMDEAGQCQVANSLIPIARSERALFVGDHRQLQPVISLDPSKNQELKAAFQIDDRYDYVDNSILKLMRKIDDKSLNILLRRHYRSHHSIIEFSNQKYYGGKLIYDKQEGKDKIQVINIDNKQDNLRNQARREIAEILRLVKEKDFDFKDIGVITPFRNQAFAINRAFEEAGYKDIKVGTVHTFQGGEKEHIIFSTALTQNTNEKAGEWTVNSEELINVAVTRAKKKFTMVCDVNVIKSLSKDDKSDLYELYQYIQKKGLEKVSQNNDVLDNFLRTDDTFSEQEFYETISHYASTQSNIRVGKKEPIKDVVKVDKKSPFYQYSLVAHFDFVLYVNEQPMMVFEIDGTEHEMVDKRKNSDMMKQALCDHYKIKLNRLPNHQTRRYDLVAEFINQKRIND